MSSVFLVFDLKQPDLGLTKVYPGLLRRNDN